MIKFKSIFRYLIIALLISVSLSGIKVIEVNAGDSNDPYEICSYYGTNF